MRQHAKIEDRLFAGMPEEVRRLQKQSRKEIRLKRRREWKDKNAPKS